MTFEVMVASAVPAIDQSSGSMAENSRAPGWFMYSGGAGRSSACAKISPSEMPVR